MTARARLHALVGTALALVALPMTIAEIRLQPARELLERAATGTSLNADELALLAQTAGTSETALAARGFTGDLDALKRLSDLAPRDCYVWAGRAYAEYNAGLLQEAALSLARSWHTGPWERLLLISRLTLSARLWPLVEPAVRPHVLAALRQAYDLYRAPLLAALPPAHAWPLYRDAFLEHPKILTALASQD